MNATVNLATIHPPPRLRALPATLPLDGAVRIELEEGVPVFRASDFIQVRIQDLVSREQEVGLTAQEREELDRYEEIDDFLSFTNRLIRNLLQPQPAQET